MTSDRNDLGPRPVDEGTARGAEPGDLPDVLLPAQWFKDPSNQNGRLLPLTPVQSLMLAVLEDAVHCYSDRDHPHPVKRRAARQAGDWLRSSDDRWLFAFETVCEHLDLEPASVRRRIFKADLSPTSDRRRSTRRVVARRGGPGAHRTAVAGNPVGGASTIQMLGGAV